ncbi:unnamed protein product [Moneuplotes crassus]|uniref:Uncharacterized protein n=1 Tax=Euplotes crassus TaxID=5936 RepID=A0AAD1XDV6_EUPCR|nr:unnamed protein product [Moneuplotes crassus]
MNLFSEQSHICTEPGNSLIPCTCCSLQSCTSLLYARIGRFHFCLCYCSRVDRTSCYQECKSELGEFFSNKFIGEDTTDSPLHALDGSLDISVNMFILYNLGVLLLEQVIEELPDESESSFLERIFSVPPTSSALCVAFTCSLRLLQACDFLCICELSWRNWSKFHYLLCSNFFQPWVQFHKAEISLAKVSPTLAQMGAQFCKDTIRATLHS